MDIHNSIVDIHNSIMDIHNCKPVTNKAAIVELIMDILNCIMGSDNRILKLEPSFTIVVGGSTFS